MLLRPIVYGLAISAVCATGGKLGAQDVGCWNAADATVENHRAQPAERSTAYPWSAADSPFGFRRGMTEQDVIAVVGHEAIIDRGVVNGFPTSGVETRVPQAPEEFGFKYQFTRSQLFPSLHPFAPEDAGSVRYMYLSTAPKPLVGIEYYVLRFYLGQGLLHVTAMSERIPAGPDGRELRSRYDAITEIIAHGRLDLRAAPEAKRESMTDLIAPSGG